jgi:hypothetical protein
MKRDPAVSLNLWMLKDSDCVRPDRLGRLRENESAGGE